MVTLLREKVWRSAFQVGLVLKGFNGVWETISGLIVFFASKATLNYWLITLAHRELVEDPNDKVVAFIIKTLLDPATSTKTFAAIYILVHGLLNVFLVIQLHHKKSWAYPATIGVMAVLVIYQFYRIEVYHSLILTALTVFDMLFIVLTWNEYTHRPKHR